MSNKRVLLINAPYVGLYGPISAAAGRYFPMGLGYIASVLREDGFEVRLVDPEAQRMNAAAVAKSIGEWRPRVVGISSATPNFSNAAAIAESAKRIDPDTTVIIGGVHASALPEYVLRRCREIDIVVVGEGEYTMREVCRALARGTAVDSGIKGIAYRDGDTIVHTEPRPFIEDIDALPLPARDLLPIGLFYPNFFNARRLPVAGVVTSRGCPFRCYFCASHVTMGSRYRARSVETVVGEVRMLVETCGIRQVLFIDDTLTHERQRVIGICESLMENGIKVEWNCFAAASNVDEEMLRTMRAAGCYSIAYGVESGDEEVLKSIKRGATKDKVRRAFEMTRKAGIKTQAFFIFGSKYETRESIDRSIAWAKELDPDLALFNTLVPYPGTEAFEDIKTPCLDAITNWDDFVAIGPRAAVEMGTLSKEELTGALCRANKTFYLRPLKLVRILLSLGTLYEFVQYVKGGLALLSQVGVWGKRGASAHRSV